MQRGANINFTNQDGKTSLTYSIIHKKTEITKWLLDADANPHIEDYTRLDSCDYAKDAQLTEFPQLNKCDPSLRIRAVRMKDLGREGL